MIRMERIATVGARLEATLGSAKPVEYSRSRRGPRVRQNLSPTLSTVVLARRSAAAAKRSG